MDRSTFARFRPFIPYPAMMTWFSGTCAAGDSPSSSAASGRFMTRHVQKRAIEGAAFIRNGVAVIVRIATASRYWLSRASTSPSRIPWNSRTNENSPTCASPMAAITVSAQEYRTARIAAPAQTAFTARTAAVRKRTIARFRARKGRSRSIPTEMKKTPLKTSRTGRSGRRSVDVVHR